MVTAVKGAPIVVLAAEQSDKTSAIAVDCRAANAVHVAVYVLGTSPSATVRILGAPDRGGNYLLLPDPNARQTGVAADAAYEVNVGTAWVKVELDDVSGTYSGRQGYTVIVTPYVSAGSRQRPNWWDRNPVAQHIGDDTGETAPHPKTTRGTYTVPSGRKALITNAIVHVVRTAAPSVTGVARATITATVNGVTLPLLDATVVDGTVGASDSLAVGQGTLLNAGDTLQCITQDTSTGGTVRYTLVAMITEFDA